ncbi:LysM peptidoglycan-binding domain-containing protein, partial [Agromyces sp. CFH 90414]
MHEDHVEEAGPPNRARTGRILRRVLAVPVALVGTIALALGSAQPAEAGGSQPPKRQPKPKATPRPAVAVATSSPAATPAPAEYVVAEGDTVSGIAERFGLPTAEVLALNGLGWSTLIFPGQRLVLGGAAPAPAVAPAAPPASAQPEITRHVVVAGDTLIGIAGRYGIGLDDLLSANGLSRSSLIFPGQSVVLPGAPPAPAPAPPPPPAPAP